MAHGRVSSNDDPYMTWLLQMDNLLTRLRYFTPAEQYVLEEFTGGWITLEEAKKSLSLINNQQEFKKYVTSIKRKERIRERVR